MSKKRNRNTPVGMGGYQGTGGAFDWGNVVKWLTSTNGPGGYGTRAGGNLSPWDWSPGINLPASVISWTPFGVGSPGWRPENTQTPVTQTSAAPGKLPPWTWTPFGVGSPGWRPGMPVTQTPVTQPPQVNDQTPVTDRDVRYAQLQDFYRQAARGATDVFENPIREGWYTGSGEDVWRTSIDPSARIGSSGERWYYNPDYGNFIKNAGGSGGGGGGGSVQNNQYGADFQRRVNEAWGKIGPAFEELRRKRRNMGNTPRKKTPKPAEPGKSIAPGWVGGIGQFNI